MTHLSSRHCVPCEGGVEKLTVAQAQDLHESIPEWTLSPEATRITRLFTFKDFAKAMAFANKIAEVAEQEWHHPDLVVAWGRVEVTFTTHSIGGLADNDFIMAAKVDALVA